MKVLLSFYPETPQYKSGIAVKNTPEKYYNPLTNWFGAGVFHCAFETYFNNVHPCFCNEYAHTMDAKIAALGHLLYFGGVLQVENRWKTIPIGKDRVLDTDGIAEIYNLDALRRLSFRHGSRLLCTIPPQPHLIVPRLMALKYHTRLNREEPQNAIEEEFINSCSLHKLEQLFTWGFVQALEMAPQNEHNKETLSDFIKAFDTISFYYPVEHLLQTYKELEITFHPGEYVYWDAHFITYSHQAVNYKNFLAKLKK